MSLTKYRMASRRQAERRSALLRRRAVLRWRRALSTYFVLCFDDVRCRALFVLCFGGAICFFLAICLLCATCFAPFHAMHAAVGESKCLRCLSLVLGCLSSLCLSLGGGGPSCFSLPFLSRRKNTGPGLRLLRAFFSMCAFYVFLLALQALQPKILARFAPLCAPRAINSTPGRGGGGHLY